MNWRLKILAKIVLSRLPLGYRTFRRLGLFRHGDMGNADYVFGVVTTHVDRLGGQSRVKDAVCLELGPGDTLASAIIANAMGARKTYLVDAGDYADRDIETYRSLALQFAGSGLTTADLSDVGSVPEMLDRLGAVYLTSGLKSLRSIPSGSVDLVWSQAVLEHVRRWEVPDFFRELHRITAAEGAMSHRIDFMDHLGGSANNLRFSPRLWESEFMASSGFYTNRIRCSEMIRLLGQAGFEIEVLDTGKWDRMPVPRAKLAAAFSSLDDEDLMTAYVDLVAAPRPISTS